jgi:dienelactone hydrolase
VRLVGGARALVAVLAAAALCAGATSAVSAAARARAATTQELMIKVSDGTKLACGLDLPAGTQPGGGWPGVILFHGLRQSHADMKLIATALAQFGFASVACDARGTGGSGGKFGLEGPREVQDARDLVAWLAARSDVSDTRIGALGLSLGGGQVLNAAAAGVPFKAIVPAITWTSLASALNPHDVPKTGLLSLLAQAIPLSHWDPALAQNAQTLLQGKVTPAVTSAEAARSARSHLHTLTVPTLLLQGRHDFLFDMDQAIAAWKLLAGPKRLYLGDLGHTPAKSPSAEVPGFVAEAAGWFEEYLGGAGGLKLRSGVELAHDPWDGTTSFYKKLPATRTASVVFPGATRLAGAAFVTRSARLTGGPHETFGAGFVRVRYAEAAKWSHLVATVSVKGRKAPVTEGAAMIKSSAGVVKIPLMDEAVLLPRGKKLVIKLGAVSADHVYASPAPPGASIKIGSATLKLSFLKRAVSK